MSLIVIQTKGLMPSNGSSPDFRLLLPQTDGAAVE